MYAIVDFKGTQFRIEKDSIIKVPFVEEKNPGDTIELKDVLMIHSDRNIEIGKPIIENAFATAEVVNHGKENKVIVFKKKRRKGYEKKQGHRQNYTEIKIKEISQQK